MPTAVPSPPSRVPQTILAAITEAALPPPLQRLLIVVHPGSACGSADFNLPGWAAANREYLARDIADWRGALLVIDGELSDELPHYPTLDMAIKQALRRAESAGLLSARLYGDANGAPDQRQVARSFVRQNRLDPATWVIELTGVWADRRTGCVTSVYDTLKRRGYRVVIRDSALRADQPTR